MTDVLHKTIIGDHSTVRTYDRSTALYSRPLLKKAKNIINAIKFLTWCELRKGDTLIIMMEEWRSRDSVALLELFPEITMIDVWCSIKEVGQNECCSPRVTVRVGIPTRTAYPDGDRVILMCSIFNDSVIREMEKQESIVRSIVPRYSSLKFRPMLNRKKKGVLSYFSGELNTLCFCKSHSVETRLYIKGLPPYREYDLRDYESRLFGYNIDVRNELVDDMPFDKAYCIAVLGTYVDKYDSDMTDIELWYSIDSELE